MSGMIGVGRGVKNQAKAGFSQAAREEVSRNSMNDQIDAAEDAEKKATIGTAGGLGLSYAMTTAAAPAATTAAATTGAAATGAMGTAAAGGGAATTGALAAMGPAGWVGLGLLAVSLL